MQDAKHILASKTFWVHILTLVLAIAATCQGDEWIAQHPEWMQFLVYFSAFMGIVLRMLTTQPVKVKPDGPSDNKPTRVLFLAAAFFAFSGGALLAYEPHDALAEVNAVRRARGLRPFLRDGDLAFAARNCVKFRADRCNEDHTQNDFWFVPARTMALVPRGPGGWLRISGGCGASGGPFAACCTFDSGWTYAGAASCRGPDGRVYHHIFVR